jgi:4-carboxymuconolactone decarboxylase
MTPVLYTTLLLVALSTKAVAQDSAIFPKGEIATVNNHTGTV